MKEVAKFDLSQNLPMNTADSVEVSYSVKGKLKFKLKAPLLEQYQGEKPFNEMRKGVEVEIYDSLRRLTSRLTSNYAIDSTYAKKMEARDNVVVVNEKGEKLETEELKWDQKTEKITSDVFVKITTSNQIIMGEGLESNQDFSEYRIIKPTGIINIEND